MQFLVKDNVNVGDLVCSTKVYDFKFHFINVPVLDYQLVAADVSMKYTIGMKERQALKEFYSETLGMLFLKWAKIILLPVHYPIGQTPSITYKIRYNIELRTALKYLANIHYIWMF